MSELADTVADVAGSHIQGYGWYPEAGMFSARVTTTEQGSPIPEVGTTVDLLLLGRLGLDLIYNPLADLKAGGSVVLETDRSPAEIWSLMPDFWRSEIRRLNVSLFTCEGGFSALLEAAKSFLSGESDSIGSQIDWAAISDPELDAHEVPRLIRRVKETGSNYDNLPRFWGEVMQPKRGGISDNFPDPLVTVGAVPPYTAALARPRATALPNIPVLDTSKCTGCGDCWPVCPDSAIGVTLLTIPELLDAAAGIKGIEGKAAGVLRRAHKQIASKASKAILKQEQPSLDADLLIEAYSSIADKLRIPEEERAEHDQIFTETAGTAAELRPVTTQRFFAKAEQSQKGSGNLLVLQINPDACQGCQLCINSCTESALLPRERAGEAREIARKSWRLWDELPDTSGAVIAKSAEDKELTPLAALLLSRHCSQIQAVGSFGEPGSGERLATRLVTAVVEAHLQERLSRQAEEVKELAESLRAEVLSELAEGLSEADSKTVEAALESLPKRRASLAELSDRLAGLGTSVAVDTVKTLRLAQTVRELEDDYWQISDGVHGLGRSRFGVVVVSKRIARWAGRFPNHPYHAPMVVEPSSDGFQTVFGLASALTLKHLHRIQLVRRARLWKEAPPDLPGQLLALESLSWQDLTLEEKQGCPPLLVFADESALTQQSLGQLSSLLTSDLPVKIILLDSYDVRKSRVDPALLAVTHQASFVLNTSLAYQDHLSAGLSRALSYPGSALIHLHAPVPSEHGFVPSDTVERARKAVDSKIHPLFDYDPSAEGVFGARASVSGNPDLETISDSSDFFDWVFGEARFESSFRKALDEDDLIPVDEYLALSEEDRAGRTPSIEHPETGETLAVGDSLARAAAVRRQIWSVYLELTGKESPFVEQIRSGLKDQVEAEHQQSFEAMKQEYESRIAELKQDIGGRMASQLRDRLLTLAGFGSANSGDQADE
jgi:pyruvate-ferredoxin/flavodoxin oxidoreductase